ncbi:MAG: hypothetical protein ACI4JT_02040 [Oscillospiraceae bacterium]
MVTLDARIIGRILANLAEFVGIFGIRICVGFWLLRSQGDFGGIEPPKSRG